MNKYRVIVREVWTQNYIVEAESEDQAKDLIFRGEGHMYAEDDTLEFSHTLGSDAMDVELIGLTIFEPADKNE